MSNSPKIRALKIEKGIPRFGKRGGGRSDHFHDFLNFCQVAAVGDSVLLTKDASNYRMAMLIAQVWLKRTFSSSPVNGGTRVWRIK